jgi:RimJ/RimL family protein N-acetyltransferase
MTSTGHDPSVPTGRHVGLRPITPEDLPWMYKTLLDPHAGPALRFGGGTPSYDEFVHSAWAHVLGQWVYVSHRSQARVGAFVVSTPDHRNGHAYIATFADPAFRSTGLAMEGTAIGIEHAFCTWPFRMLYADVTRPAFEQFSGVLGRIADIEGVRKASIWMRGSYQDLLMVCITRDRWEERGRPFVRSFLNA